MRTSKHERIADELLQGIRSGEFGEQDQLPSERVLAERYKVTRATARRALGQLEEMGLVERRGAAGTIVRSGRTGEGSVAVSLICTAETRTVIDEFLHWGTYHVSRRNWSPRVVRLERHDESHITRALAVGNPCLLFGEPVDFRPRGPLERQLRRARHRMVVVGTRMDHAGIASVVANDLKGMALALNRLAENGHRRIALVTDNTPLEHPTLNIEYSTWRRGVAQFMSESDVRDHLIQVETTPYRSVALSAYEAVKLFLQSPKSKQTTALICLDRELADGAAAAARDVHRPVPEQLSLIEYGGSTNWPLAFPLRDSVDVRVDRHIEVALQLLDLAMKRKLDPADCLRMIEPTLVVRGSVRRTG
jgi:DNA-binding LacI/PurR family transcriptional regulator